LIQAKGPSGAGVLLAPPPVGPSGPIGAAQVQLVRWPRDRERRSALAEAGQPRVLLVAEDVDPPALDDLEDWIRVPADELDLFTRMRRLAVLAGQASRPPELVDGVILRHGEAAVLLGETDAALARLLIDRIGQLVLRRDIEAALWPGGVPGARTLDARVNRLRHRAAEVGLTLHTIRGRGFVLDLTQDLEEQWPTS
jgi:hypothetical protein